MEFVAEKAVGEYLVESVVVSTVVKMITEVEKAMEVTLEEYLVKGGQQERVEAVVVPEEVSVEEGSSEGKMELVEMAVKMVASKEGEVIAEDLVEKEV